MATAKRVKQSIIVRMYLLPLRVIGYKPLPQTMFIATESPRTLTFIGFNSAHWVRLSFKNLSHTAQLAMKILTSRFIVCQLNTRAIFAVVALAA